MKAVLAVAAGLLALFLGEHAARAADIAVMSTTGLQAALEALAPKLEQATGDKLAMTIGPANDLKDKIEGGAPFDVTVLTPALIDTLIHVRARSFRVRPPTSPAPVLASPTRRAGNAPTSRPWRP